MTDFDFSKVKVTETAETIERTRTAKPNPLYGHVVKAYENMGTTYKITIPVEAGDDAYNMLRRAQKTLTENGQEFGLRIERRENGKNVDVLFVATAKKVKRYTVEDVREWARSKNVAEELLTPRVHKDVSAAYREAHDL